MKMYIVGVNEDSEIFSKVVDNLENYEYLSDVCGEYGLEAVDFRPVPLSKNLAYFIDDCQGENVQGFEEKVNEFKKTIEGKAGFSLWYSSIDGQDSILGFIEGTVDEVMKIWEEQNKE